MKESLEDGFIKIGEAGELPENSRLFVEFDGQPITIVNLAGKLFAFSDVCTHDDGPIGEGQLDGYEIVCPRHGARFDIRTGKATRSPAFRDILTYPVKIQNGSIYIKTNE